MNLQKIKEVLRHKELAPLKKLGQNFLVYPETAARIVQLAGVSPDDTILELGVGLGTLTGPLAQRARHVVGLEIDSGIITWQNSGGNLADNVTLIHQDLLLHLCLLSSFHHGLGLFQRSTHLWLSS